MIQLVSLFVLESRGVFQRRGSGGDRITCLPGVRHDSSKHRSEEANTSHGLWMKKKQELSERLITELENVIENSLELHTCVALLHSGSYQGFNLFGIFFLFIPSLV